MVVIVLPLRFLVMRADEKATGAVELKCGSKKIRASLTCKMQCCETSGFGTIRIDILCNYNSAALFHARCCL